MTNFKLTNTDNSSEHIEELQVISKLLKDAYEGRVKPDNKGDKGTIRESLDNMPFIKLLQSRVAQLLELKIKDYE